MKYLVKPLYKSVALFVLSFLAIYIAPYCIDFMMTVDLGSWIGIEIPQDNQDFIKILMLIFVLTILSFLPVDFIFGEERILRTIIPIYLISLFGVALFTEVGALQPSIIWNLALGGWVLISTILFSKYYFIPQNKEEEH